MPKQKFAPLDSTYMGISLVGLIISLYYLINPEIQIASFFISFFIIILLIFTFRKGRSDLPYVIMSILGIIASIIFYHYINSEALAEEVVISHMTWGITFAIFFGYMFVSAMTSMTKAEPAEFIRTEEKKS